MVAKKPSIEASRDDARASYTGAILLLRPSCFGAAPARQVVPLSSLGVEEPLVQPFLSRLRT
jgi:hypothetical protein